MDKLKVKSELLKQFKRSRRKKDGKKSEVFMSERLFKKMSRVNNNFLKSEFNHKKEGSGSKQHDFKFKSFQKTIRKIDSILHNNGSNKVTLERREESKQNSAKKALHKRISSFDRTKPVLKELSKRIYPSTGRIKNKPEFYEKFNFSLSHRKPRKLSYDTSGMEKDKSKETNDEIDANYVKIKNFFAKKVSHVDTAKKVMRRRKKGKSFDASSRRKKSVGQIAKRAKEFDMKVAKLFKTMNYKELSKNIREKNKQQRKIMKEKNSGKEQKKDDKKMSVKEVLEKLSEGKKTHRKIYSTHNFEQYLKRKQREDEEFDKPPKKRSHRRQYSSYNHAVNVNSGSGNMGILKSANFSPIFEIKEPVRVSDMNPKTMRSKHKRIVSMNFFSASDFNMEKMKKDISCEPVKIKPALTSNRKNGPIFSFAVNNYKSKKSMKDEDRISLHMNNTKIPIEGLNGKLASLTYCFFGLYEGVHGNCCSDFFKKKFHKTLFKSPYILTNVVKAIKLTLMKLQNEYFTLRKEIGISSRTTCSASIFFTLGKQSTSKWY